MGGGNVSIHITAHAIRGGLRVQEKAVCSTPFWTVKDLARSVRISRDKLHQTAANGRKPDNGGSGMYLHRYRVLLLQEGFLFHRRPPFTADKLRAQFTEMVSSYRHHHLNLKRMGSLKERSEWAEAIQGSA